MSQDTNSKSQIDAETNGKNIDSIFKKNRKLIGGITLGAALFAGGMFYQSSASEPKDNNTLDDSEYVIDGKVEKVPSEARDFVAEHRHDYSDPVSTYYAVEELKKTYPDRDFILSDEFIQDYKPYGQHGNESVLGFKRYSMMADQEINQEVTIKMFNEYTSKMMELYLNYTNLNRHNPEALKIIGYEFEMYTSTNSGEYIDGRYFTNENATFKKDNDIFDSLKTFLDNTVSKYSDSSVFHVPAASTKESSDKTVFFEGYMTGIGEVEYYGQKLTQWGDGAITLRIIVKDFDREKYSQIIDSNDGVQLSAIQQTAMGDAPNRYISIGMD